MDSQDSLVSTYAQCGKKTAHCDEWNLKDFRNVLLKRQLINTGMKNQPSWPEKDAKLFLQAMHEVGSMGGVADVEPITIEMMESIQNFVLNSSIDMNQLQGIAPADLSEKISDQKTQTTPSNPHSSYIYWYEDGPEDGSNYRSIRRTSRNSSQYNQRLASSSR